MLRSIPVQTDALHLLGLTVEPKIDYESKLQKTTADGVLVWSVTAYAVTEADTLKVSVAAPTSPEVAPGQPITFVGLRAGVYASGAQAHFYWSAEGIA